MQVISYLNKYVVQQEWKLKGSKADDTETRAQALPCNRAANSERVCLS